MPVWHATEIGIGVGVAAGELSDAEGGLAVATAPVAELEGNNEPEALVVSGAVAEDGREPHAARINIAATAITSPLTIGLNAELREVLRAHWSRR